MLQQTTTKYSQQHSTSTNNSSPYSKISISFPSQINHLEEDDSDTPVLVYLFAHNSKSIKISFSPSISVQDVKSAAEDLIGIRKDKQNLYLNGKNITNYGNIRLKTNNIIHISNKDQVCHQDQKIKLRLTLINFIDQKQPKIYKEYTVSGNERIISFLGRVRRDLDQKLVFLSQNQHLQLLQSGRLLQKQNTFIEQNVSSYTTMTCILTKNEIKTRFVNDTEEEIFNDISELLGFGEQTQKKADSKDQQRNIAHNVGNVEQKKHNSFIKQEKLTNNQDFTQHIKQQPNFKKKKNNLFTREELKFQGEKLLKKLKSSKTKRHLDQLLNFQEGPNSIIEQSTIIKKQQKKQKQLQIPELSSDLHKAALLIPKGMPIQQRKQIRMQMQKLLNASESAKTESVALKDDLKTHEFKEQKKPISPATQTPKPKQKMRLSMGSRPAFLDQLKF